MELLMTIWTNFSNFIRLKVLLIINLLRKWRSTALRMPTLTSF